MFFIFNFLTVLNVYLEGPLVVVLPLFPAADFWIKRSHWVAPESWIAHQSITNASRVQLVRSVKQVLFLIYLPHNNENNAPLYLPPLPPPRSEVRLSCRPVTLFLVRDSASCSLEHFGKADAGWHRDLHLLLSEQMLEFLQLQVHRLKPGFFSLHHCLLRHLYPELQQTPSFNGIIKGYFWKVFLKWNYILIHCISHLLLIEDDVHWGSFGWPNIT